MLTSDVVARLRAILDTEGRGACIRIRESKVGSC